MVNHLYLPQVESKKIVRTTQEGCWENQDIGILRSISDGITVTDADKARRISSIPSIWARPLMFQLALGKKDKLRDNFLQEWRGLLSLLAMAQIKNYTIEIMPVKLGSDVFSIALTKLAPSPIKLEPDKEYPWVDIFLILFDKIPIGAFSPATLVYTACDYSDKIKNKKIPLYDPSKNTLCEPKDPEDLEAIGKWLCNLEKKYENILSKDHHHKDIEIITNVVTLLADWINEIREKLGIETKDINSKELTISTEILDTIDDKTREELNKYPVYKMLLYPLTKDSNCKKDYNSDMALKLNQERNNSGYKEVVIITRHLLSKNLKIWDRIKLKDLGGDVENCLKNYFNAASGTQINRINLEQGAIWIRPELYFLTNNLYYAKTGNFLVEEEGELNFSRKYLLPFKKEILDFYSPTQIKEKLKPSYKEERDGVRFTFFLPSVKEEEIIIEKFYKKNFDENYQCFLKEIEIPIIEVFPNYIDKNWRRHYLFQNQSDHFSIFPYIDSQDEHKKIEERTREVVYGNQLHKVRLIEISSNNAFPDGIEFKDIKNQNEVMGIILLSRPKEPQEEAKEWKIGIDFGTSNTNIYYLISGAESAQKCVFELHSYMRRLTMCENNLRESLLSMIFVPPKKTTLPIPSMLRLYSLNPKRNLLLDYFIHFPFDYKSPPHVYSDIKWDTDQEERKTKFFLESLLFLILIEVRLKNVKNLHLVYAFPKAFSDDSKTILKRDWETAIIGLLEKEDCIIQKYDKKSFLNEPDSALEGKAAGYYFNDARTIKTSGEEANLKNAICLDVGGGTTDISIWHENDIFSDASILLAGRQISVLFQKNRRVRDLLFSGAANIALDEKVNEPNNFAGRLNIILKKEESEIQQLLIDHFNKSDIQWLRKMLTIEFCAISYYTAMLVAATDKIEGTEILSGISETGIKLHWGGNAAKFINFINLGKYDKFGIASKMLSAVFFQALKDVQITAKEIVQLQSPGHKDEVAGGLVVMNLEKESESSHSKNEMVSKKRSVICGEKIIILKKTEEKTIDYLQSVTSQDLFDDNSKTTFKKTTLERLLKFIDIINFFALDHRLFNEDTKIRLDDQQKQIIIDQVYKSFVDAQNKSAGQRIIEPVFIMEVRVLLKLLLDELR